MAESPTLDLGDMADMCRAVKGLAGVEQEVLSYINSQFRERNPPRSDMIRAFLDSPWGMVDESDYAIQMEVEAELLAEMEKETDELLQANNLKLGNKNNLYSECSGAYHKVLYGHMQFLALQRAIALSGPWTQWDGDNIHTPGTDDGDLQKITDYTNSMVRELQMIELQPYLTGPPRTGASDYAFHSKWRVKHREPSLSFDMEKSKMDILNSRDVTDVSRMLANGLFEKGSLLKGQKLRLGPHATLPEGDVQSVIFGDIGGVWDATEAQKLQSSGVNIVQVQSGIFLRCEDAK